MHLSSSEAHGEGAKDVADSHRHSCADVRRNIEGARYLLYNAARKVQEGLEYAAAVAMTKAYASEACLWAARNGHQIMGAIGQRAGHEPGQVT